MSKQHFLEHAYEKYASLIRILNPYASVKILKIAFIPKWYFVPKPFINCVTRPNLHIMAQIVQG